MSLAGELDLRLRRSSTPGANGQILFNQNGVEGTNANLTWDNANANLSVIGSVNASFILSTNASHGNLTVTQNVVAGNINVANINVSANISNVGNLLITQNTFTGNLSVTQNLTMTTGNISVANINVSAIANLAALISPNATTYANGTVVIASANHNFNNTATINVVATANGSQANLSFTANANAIIASANQSNLHTVVEANGQIQIDYVLGPPGGAGGAYQVDILANGAVIVANANLNFINTISVNVGITSNGSSPAQANAGFTLNVLQAAINTAPITNPAWYSFLSGAY